MEFIVKFKKPNQWFWRKRKVIGFITYNSNVSYNTVDPKKGNTFIQDLAKDSAELIFSDLTKEIIPNWSSYQYKVGLDWLEATRLNAEKTVGIPVTLNK